MSKNLHKLIKTSWKNVREEVWLVNQKLVEIIDQIDPSEDYVMYKATYPYGEEILKKGKLYLPNNAPSMVSLEDSTLTNEIRENLGYNIGTNPVSLILKGSAEIFMFMDNHTIPFFYGIIPPGKVFSTWRVLMPLVCHSPAFLWNISAGARSLFMLPKISEYAAHQKLKKELRIRVDAPISLLDHWQVFKEIVNSPHSNCEWCFEIIYFSKKWFENLNENKWKEFYLYLLKNAWEGSDFWRNQFTWDLIFSQIQKNKNLKPNPYIADTVKHLLTTAVGAVPAFAPALSDLAAPISFIQSAYLDIYQLKNYYPTIMTPHFFNLYAEGQAVYYSTHYPCTIEFSPRSRKASYKTSECDEIQYLLEKYLVEIKNARLNIQHTPLYDIPDKVSFDFFHNEINKFSCLRKSDFIPKEDPTFIPSHASSKNNSFPNSCAFVKGCIRIKKQSNLSHLEDE